jgi:PAS domain S-box-containing protein
MPPSHAPVPAAVGLFDRMADAVYLLDPGTSRIVWGNRAAWESLGLSAQEVLDHSVLSLQMDVTGLPQWSDIAAAIRATECFTFVGRHRHAAGHEVAVEVNTTRLLDDGREYFLSVARDISRRWRWRPT